MSPNNPLAKTTRARVQPFQDAAAEPRVVTVPVRSNDAGKRVFYATVVATSAEVTPTPARRLPLASSPGMLEKPKSVVQELQTYYQPSTGLFNTTGWWNSANALDAIIDYMERTGSTTYLSDVSNTFALAANGAPPPTPGNFIDTAYDDTQWWALTWLNAYQLTGNQAYLQMAETIFTYATGAWQSSQCGGGLIWQTTNNYQNSVTNELFLELAARHLPCNPPGDLPAVGAEGAHVVQCQRPHQLVAPY